MSFTILFDGDLRRLVNNPFKTATPFGMPRAVSAGDVFDDCDRLESECDRLKEALERINSNTTDPVAARIASEALRKAVV